MTKTWKTRTALRRATTGAPEEIEQPFQVELLQAFREARDPIERGEAVIALVASNPTLMLDPALGREIARWHRIASDDAWSGQHSPLTPERAAVFMDRLMATLAGLRSAEPKDESKLLAQLASTDPLIRGEAAVQLLESSPDYIVDPLVGMTIIEWHREIRRGYRNEIAGPAAMSAADARDFLDRTMRRFMRSGRAGKGMPDLLEFRLEDLVAQRVIGQMHAWCRAERQRTKRWPLAESLSKQFEGRSGAVIAMLLNERHSIGVRDGVRRQLAPRRAADQFLAERYGVSLKTIETWRRRTNAAFR